ncbi:hypothetical protein FJZ36_10205 [Candidatus Poribacteria bacterium]|nr:hypothetical protein [Candidatus Poribacteria bacterium]
MGTPGRVRPHLTDDQLSMPQEEIVAAQRQQLARLGLRTDELIDLARSAHEELGVPTVLLWNTTTDEVLPTPLDWEGHTNVHALPDAVYESARGALTDSCDGRTLVVVMYDGSNGMTGVYALSTQVGPT